MTSKQHYQKVWSWKLRCLMGVLATLSNTMRWIAFTVHPETNGDTILACHQHFSKAYTEIEKGIDELRKLIKETK